jgi:hypothetical protein
VRRSFCDENSCERRIFCERLSDAAAHAPETGRMEAAFLLTAFELGTERRLRKGASGASTMPLPHPPPGGSVLHRSSGLEIKKILPSVIRTSAFLAFLQRLA